GGGDVAVARREAQLAAAHAGQQRPPLRELPPGLRVEIAVVDAVALVAPQRAAHAQRVADEVLVAAPVLALAVGVAAGGELERTPGQRTGPTPAQVDAAVVVVQVDHAAGAERIARRAHRHRQELLDLATPAVTHGLERMAARQRLLPAQAQLVLARRLARAVLRGDRGGLARIVLHLVPGQAQR